MTETPFVSVVIPMRNERVWIERCLASVLAQDWPADRMEVIVADGMSDDGSLEVVQALADRDSRLRIVRNPARIVPAGLNRAIEESRGEVVARIDAHTTIEPDYIRQGVELLRRTGAQNVGGPMRPLGGGAVGDAIATAMCSRFGIGAYFHFAEEEREVDTVYMGMWPREVFRRVGMFDEELVRNQDDEFSYRIRRAGGRVVVSPRMRSHYQNRRSWGALARQFFQYGLWKVRVLQKHPAQMSVRHFIPPLFDAGLLASILVGHPLFAAAGAAGYGAAMAAVAVREARRRSDPFRVFLALAMIHHAWACGFLAGLIRFAHCWFRPEQPARRLASAADS